MRRLARLLPVLLLLPSCIGGPGGPDPGPKAEPPRLPEGVWELPPVEPGFDADALAARTVLPHRQVGFLPPGKACAAFVDGDPHWKGEALFGDTAEGWCFFETQAGVADLDERVARLDALVTAAGGAIGPDRLVVSPAGTLDESAAPGFEEQVRQEVGYLGWEGDLPEAGRVRLVLLDNAPTSANPLAGQEPAVRHGEVLARLAGELLCVFGNGECPVEIRTELAMPMAGLGPKEREAMGVPSSFAGRMVAKAEKGGQFGTLVQLARAVDVTVSSYQTDHDRTGGPSALVLNLSLGWIPSLDGSTDDAWTPAVTAVYRSLRRASCHGALAFAAGGNRSGGPDADEGLILPAAWNQTSPAQAKGLAGPHAPDLSCDALGGADTGLPVVIAVGGVSRRGRLLGNGRTGGQPDLLAYGDHVVTEGPGMARVAATSPMTGTSASALVASASAVALWTRGPNEPAGAIRKVLLDASEPLVLPSLDDTGAKVTAGRVDLCTGKGQGGLGHFCVQPPRRGQADFSALGAWYTAAVSATPGFTEVGPSTVLDDWRNRCGAESRLFQPPGSGSADCPSDEIASIYDVVDAAPGNEPLVKPQPPPVRCPSCLLAKKEQVLLLQDAELATHIKPVLRVEYQLTETTRRVVSWSLDGLLGPEVASPGVVIPFGPSGESGEIVRARIETVSEGVSYIHPLFVVEQVPSP